MNIEKRGQIALFIIIGILILGAFGFLFYASSVLQGPADSGTGSGQVSHTKQSSVEEYIQSVTIDSFNECFALLGPQGGKIYDSSFPVGDQYGNSAYNPPSYMMYESHKPIGLGIKSGFYNNIYRGRSGDTIDNAVNIVYNKGGNYIYGLNAPLPPMSSDGGPESMETQFSDCTRKRFVKYFDKTLFENYAVYFLTEEPIVNVSINLEDIGITVYYPVRIETGETIVTTEDYYYTLNYPFSLLYRFVRDIIREDMYTLDVKIVGLSKDNYVVTREEARNVDEKTGLKYDVITVTDQTFEFQNEPYNFSFIRENRAPDASTVDHNPKLVYYSDEELVLYCPNYYTKRSIVDPDEDDFYAVKAGKWEGDWYGFATHCDADTFDPACGNEESPVRIPTEKCHVCCPDEGGRFLVACIEDYGKLEDCEPRSKKIVKCRPGEEVCCGPSECWDPSIICDEKDDPIRDICYVRYCKKRCGGCGSRQPC